MYGKYYAYIDAPQITTEESSPDWQSYGVVWGGHELNM